MVTTQITRRKNADTSETLRKHSDGTTETSLPFRTKRGRECIDKPYSELSEEEKEKDREWHN